MKKIILQNFLEGLAKSIVKEPVLRNIFKWFREPIEGNQLTLEEFLSLNLSSVEPILREFLSG
jgi:hypothetical protein